MTDEDLIAALDRLYDDWRQHTILLDAGDHILKAFARIQLKLVVVVGVKLIAQHIKTSGKSLEYFDPETNEKYVPYVIEPSLGVERLFLSVVTEAYDEEEIVSTDKNGNEKRETRTVMRLHPALAPYKCAVLPLVKKLTPKAEEVYDMLSRKFMVDFDEAGTIGKRYRRQDEIGTPFCITYDFDTLEKDNCVTVRNRDTMQQERVAISDLIAYIEERVTL